MSRRLTLRALACSLIFTLSAALLPDRASGQAGFGDLPAAASDSRTIPLDQGIQFERAGNWAEALQHYETLHRRFPHDQTLEDRLEYCRWQFDIVRRYDDESFRATMLRLPREQALALYQEVLVRIETHYVDPVSMQALFQAGTDGLMMALGNQRFEMTHLASVPPERVELFRADIERLTSAMAVRNRRDAVAAVGRVCDFAWHHFQMPAAVVVMEYLYGTCHHLDHYTTHLTPSRLDDLYAQIDGNFVGIGIEIRGEQGRGLNVVKVLSGSPAEEGGLRAGDYIVAIDGADSRGMTADEAAGRLRGNTGSAVTLQIDSQGALRQVRLVRRAVEVRSVEQATMIDPQAGIAYVQLTGFQDTSAAELSRALWQLHSQGMRYLILDVRGNPGGLLSSAVEILDLFINDGVLVSTRGRSPEQNVSYAARPQGTWRVPLILLIDGDSASASEIVAGAIRDDRRGILVGRRTYGKGSVQSIYDLTTVGTGLRLTTARFYSPHGLPINEVGVEPDVPVTLPDGRTTVPADQVGTLSDPDLAEALRIARRQMGLP